MRRQGRAATLVKPLGLHPDLARRRLAAFDTPLKHLHAVGHFDGSVTFVHGIAIGRAGLVGEAGAANKTTRLLLRMIEAGQQLPVTVAAVNGVVFEAVTVGISGGRIVQ